MSDSNEALIELLDRHSQLLPPMPALLRARMAGSPPDQAVDVEAGPDVPLWPPLGDYDALNRAIGCLLGLAVGEAIGAPAEGLERGSFPLVAAPSGGGIRGLAPGGWGCGTAMALCLADSLLSYGDVDLEDFMLRLASWLESGDAGSVRSFDADPAVRSAVARFAAER